MWLLWLSPRLRDAWDSNHHWSGIFSSFSEVYLAKAKVFLIPCPQALQGFSYSEIVIIMMIMVINHTNEQLVWHTHFIVTVT